MKTALYAILVAQALLLTLKLAGASTLSWGVTFAPMALVGFAALSLIMSVAIVVIIATLEERSARPRK